MLEYSSIEGVNEYLVMETIQNFNIIMIKSFWSQFLYNYCCNKNHCLWAPALTNEYIKDYI